MATSETAGGEADPERVLAAIEREVEAIKRRELEEAIDALESRGEVTEKQRRAVEDLADGIAAALLEPPAETLREAERNGDPRAVETAIDLFDPER